MEDVRAVWLDMMAALSDGEEVHVLVNDRITREDVASRLARRGLSRNIFLHEVPTDDAWIRDSGPLFVRSPEGIAATQWIFNAWGKKYEPWENDRRVARHVAEIVGCPSVETEIVLEGGSIDMNGEGLCLATRQCLLNANRNPQLTQGEIEAWLAKVLGAQEVIWLMDGIAGDDTDGHVDDVARFVSSRTVVAALEKNQRDENFAPLAENAGRLRSWKDSLGRHLTVVPLPMPRPVTCASGRLPASYANFYISNSVVLVPVFTDPADREALAIFKDLFPRRAVVGLDARALVLGLGAIHCVTQQQPA